MRSRNILVTGATKGIGLEIVRSLLECGDSVYGVARSAEVPEDLSTHERFTYRVCDVGSPEDVERIFHDLPVAFDLMVNCAGVLMLRDTMKTEIVDWEETMRVNTSGSFYVAKYGTQHFLDHGKKGMIIFIGSRWGSSGSAKAPAYAASKSALRSLVKSLQAEGIVSGIRYLLLSPGSVLTGMSRSVDARVGEDILEPRDIAELVVYLSQTPERVIFDEISIKAFPYDFTHP